MWILGQCYCCWRTWPPIVVPLPLSTLLQVSELLFRQDNRTVGCPAAGWFLVSSPTVDIVFRHQPRAASFMIVSGGSWVESSPQGAIFFFFLCCSASSKWAAVHLCWPQTMWLLKTAVQATSGQASMVFGSDVAADLTDNKFRGLLYLPCIP